VFFCQPAVSSALKKVVQALLAYKQIALFYFPILSCSPQAYFLHMRLTKQATFEWDLLT
jgi:hypothetical protein